MGVERLVKQVFLESVTMTQTLASNSIIKPWAGQVASFLASLGMPQDLSAPQTVHILAAAEQLQSRYLALVTGSTGSKMQQYLRLRSVVESELHPSCLSAGCWWLEAAPSSGSATHGLSLAGG